MTFNEQFLDMKIPFFNFLNWYFHSSDLDSLNWVTMGLTAIAGPGLGVPFSIEHVICSNKVLAATFVPQLRSSEPPLPITF